MTKGARFPSIGSRAVAVSKTVAVGLFAGLVAGQTARAETAMRPPDTAQALFEEAKQLLKAGDWPGACDRFRRSMDLDPAVSTQAKLAKCHEHAGQLGTAWYDYRHALELAHDTPLGEQRRRELEKYIRAAIASLEPRLPKVQISVDRTPAGLEVLCDGRPVPLGTLEQPLPVDPGTHEFVARAPGFQPARVVVVVVEGALANVELGLVPEPSPAPSATATPSGGPVEFLTPPAAPAGPRAGPPSAPSGSRPTPSRAYRTVGVSLGGAGLLTLAAAGYLGVRTLVLVHDSNQYCTASNDCYEQGVNLRHRALNTQTTGLILAGIGAMTLGAGITLFAMAPSSDHPASETAATTIQVMLTPAGASTRATW
jgi:hypothetical protein